MSDTDDTDFLLLIPPDFFLIHSSDSEDYQDRGAQFNKSEIECTVVNSLISQVNELEDRVCAIENTESSAPSSINSHCNQSFNSLPSVLSSKLRCDSSKISHLSSNNSRFLGSADNVAQISSSHDSAYNSQSFRSHNFSLPSTPDNQVNKSLPNLSTNHYLYTKAGVDISDNGNQTYNGNTGNSEMSSLNSENNSPAKQIDQKKLIDEIDQYFNKYFHFPNSVTRNNMEVPSGSLKSSDSTPQSREKELHLNDLKDSGMDAHKIKHLELPEVDKLLNEMERTQSEIERKLKVREAQFNKPVIENYDSSRIYQPGDAIGSVPDMGFGLRDIYYSKGPNDSSRGPPANRAHENKAPVIEDPCIEKRITTLGNGCDEPRTTYSQSVSQSPDSKFSSQNDFKSAASSLINSYGESVGGRFRQKLNFNSQQFNIKPIGICSEVRGIHDDNMLRLAGRDNASYKSKTTSVLSTNPNYDRVHDGYSSTEEKVTDKSDTGSLRKKRPPIRRYCTRLNSYGSKVSDGIAQGKFSKQGDFEDKHSSIPNSARTKMMSLSELWNAEKSQLNENNPKKLQQRLEEENYRRQHCEQQIHDLQRRVLEDQEKLAVAVRVDKEKDRAIERMWAGWQQLANHWHELEEQRHALSQQLEEQARVMSCQSEEISNKVERWERELSQALELAADYKNKSESIIQERDQLRHEMDSCIADASVRLNAAENEKSKYMQENRILLDKLAESEIGTDKDRQLISEYKEKLRDVERKLNELEAEVSVLREQKDNMNTKLKEEKSRNSMLEQQKSDLQNSLEECRKKEKTLRDEVKSSTERLEVARVELRALYQGQLEAVVKEKMKEFQGQLDAAEAAMRAVLLSKEKEMAERAIEECHKLSENHKMELQRQDERHRNEIRSLRSKLQAMEQQKLELNIKLQKEAGQRADMAQKLHGVMETHWRQALQIISNSPAGSGDHINKVEEEGRKRAWTSKDEKRLMAQQEDLKLELSKLMSHANGDDGSPGSDTPFNTDTGQTTYRVTALSGTNNGNTNTDQAQNHHHHYHHHHQQTQSQQAQSQLQSQQPSQLRKYIQMLLDRAPGNPVNDSSSQLDSSLKSSSLNESQTSWAKLMNIDEGKQSLELPKTEPIKQMRNSKNSKQPWK